MQWQGCDCDGCEGGGYIFGGYTDVAWEVVINHKFHLSTESFLFRLKDHAGTGPVKMPIKSSKTGFAAGLNSGLGPIFGSGGNFFVFSNVNSK